MEKKHKKLYESPSLDVLELKPEGVFCQSLDLNLGNPFGNNTETDWESELID